MKKSLVTALMFAVLAFASTAFAAAPPVIDTGQFLAKAASGASSIEAASTKQDLNPFLLSVALLSHGAAFAVRSELTPAFAAIANIGVIEVVSTANHQTPTLWNEPSKRELHLVAHATQNSAATLL